MLVQALAHYADTDLSEELADLAFEEKPVQFWLNIDEKGHFVGIEERVITEQVGKKSVTRAETLRIAKSPVNRNSGINPLLACDSIQYVVGPALDSWTTEDKVQNHAERHAGFAELIGKAAEETKDEALKACAAFYGNPSQVEKARKDLVERGIKTTQPNVCLSFSPASATSDDPGGPVVKRRAVREYWRKHYNTHFTERHAEGGKGMCLISGKVGPIAVTHERIKGTASLGGQAAGVSLMSYDKKSFQSYGWEQNLNSPVSPERAMAYVLALNDLLKPGQHRRGIREKSVVTTRSDHGGLAFLYWTKEATDLDLREVYDYPDPVRVRNMLYTPASGQRPKGSLSNEFYLLAVTGNGGRLVVRDWFREKLEVIEENIRQWFRDLFIVNVFDPEEKERFPSIFSLLSVISRPGEDSNDKVQQLRSLQFYRRALMRQPLGLPILAMALDRLRVAKDSNRLNPTLLGLIRLCVNDSLRITGKGESIMNENLDEGLKHPAYICGRLLAMFDSLQYSAQGGLNVTVADRYFSLASTYPQLAFPKLEQLSRAHLKKLRRDNPGAAYSIEQRLHELSEALGMKYPGQQSLEDQGRFAIGFHHQKAEDQRRIKEAVAKKSAVAESNQ